VTGLGELVRIAIEETRDENPARFTIDVSPDLMLDVDFGLIRRVLMQLLENAHKYSPPDSPILIEGRIEDGQAVISIMDRGPGIPKDEVDRVFEKFYRGRGSRGKTEGTGMGLAIAKGIIEAHGGRIRAQNRQGGGAVIVFSLPLPAIV
jgi:two-component system, OmpR family, sensor histidine kinase KdpD